MTNSVSNQVENIVGVFGSGILSAEAAASAICGVVKIQSDVLKTVASAASTLGLSEDQTTELGMACAVVMKAKTAGQVQFVATIVPATDKYPCLVNIKGGAYSYKPKSLSPRLLAVILEHAAALKPVVDKALKS